MATYLGCNLRDTPPRFVAGLPAHQHGNWALICRRFGTQFGLQKMKSIYQQELAMRMQKKGESWRDLSLEVKMLAELAYPGPDSPTRDAIILTHLSFVPEISKGL